jgi:Leucine-rich repeat (LRR) protein
MPAAEPTSPKPKLRWYQFSLRTLLIFVTFSAILCSFFATITYSARKQKEVAATIRKLGGAVVYDYLMVGEDGCDIDVDTLERPNTLSKYFGVDYFHSVECVFCEGSKINDSILAPLRSLPNVIRLDLRHTQVTDSGLKSLIEMPSLKLLILDGTPIGDEGLECLQGMRNLRDLDLTNTKITDKGLENLRGLTQLDGLILDDTKITDSGLAHIARLTQLQSLLLANTDISDKGIEHLKGLRQLHYIDLEGTQVTDSGVEELKKALPRTRIK